MQEINDKNNDIKKIFNLKIETFFFIAVMPASISSIVSSRYGHVINGAIR
jgi:hypothetical protein